MPNWPTATSWPTGVSWPTSLTNAQAVQLILNGMTVPWILDAAAPSNTIVTGTVAVAKDQTGNGFDFTPPGSAPLYSATGGPTNGPYFATAVASTRYLRNTVYAAPTAGTTPFFIYGIVRVDAWSTGSLWAAKSGTGLPNVSGSTAGKFQATNGVAGPEVAVTAGTWLRFYALFNNSAVVDKLRMGAADSGVGTALGNTASGAGFFIGINSSALDASYSFLFTAHGAPSGAQLTALDSLLAGGAQV